MAALRLRFDANRAGVQASRLLATVPAEHRLVEGIAWDARRPRLFAATVVGRALLVREPLGWVKVEGLEAGSLFGLAIDRRAASCSGSPRAGSSRRRRPTPPFAA